MNLTVILLVAIGLTLGMMVTHTLSDRCKTGSTLQTVIRVVYLLCAMGMILCGLSLIGAAVVGGSA